MWAVALLLFAALIQWSGSLPSTVDPSREGVTDLARSLNRLRPPTRNGRHPWAVTKALSAKGALVLEVVSTKPADAQEIAERLVADVHSQYDEILIYVQSVDTSRDRTIHRVAWTPRRGYVASTF